eukprot:6213945-Pleurochrysis_carterae.AAC.2
MTNWGCFYRSVDRVLGRVVACLPIWCAGRLAAVRSPCLPRRREPGLLRHHPQPAAPTRRRQPLAFRLRRRASVTPAPEAAALYPVA